MCLCKINHRNGYFLNIDCEIIIFTRKGTLVFVTLFSQVVFFVYFSFSFSLSLPLSFFLSFSISLPSPSLSPPPPLSLSLSLYLSLSLSLSISLCLKYNHRFHKQKYINHIDSCPYFKYITRLKNVMFLYLTRKTFMMFEIKNYIHVHVMFKRWYSLSVQY